MSNGLPLNPRRFCRKKIGPGEFSLMHTAVIANNGSKRIKPVRAPKTSMDRFKPRSKVLSGARCNSMQTESPNTWDGCRKNLRRYSDRNEIHRQRQRSQGRKQFFQVSNAHHIDAHHNFFGLRPSQVSNNFGNELFLLLRAMLFERQCKSVNEAKSMLKQCRDECAFGDRKIVGNEDDVTTGKPLPI